MVSRLIDELMDLKELRLPRILERNGPTNLAREILRKASTKSTPVNIKYKFYYHVICLLDVMIGAVGNNPAAAMMQEALDSPPSNRSDDESPSHSIYSTTDYDPGE